MIATDLTSKNAPDASRVPALVKQIKRPLGSVCADGAYDSEAVYKAVENHTDNRSPRVLIPPKKNARVRPATPTTRERNRNIRSRVSWARDSGTLGQDTAVVAWPRTGWPHWECLKATESTEPETGKGIRIAGIRVMHQLCSSNATRGPGCPGFSCSPESSEPIHRAGNGTARRGAVAELAVLVVSPALNRAPAQHRAGVYGAGSHERCRW